MKLFQSIAVATLLVLTLPSGRAACQVIPFYPGGTYDPKVPTPDSVLGFAIGQRPARYDEAVRYLKLLSQASPRVRLNEMGETYESRKQYYLTITSESNTQKLETIRQTIQNLAAGGGSLTDDAALRSIASTPAVAWMAYGIHGDELSSVDAALQLAYQLAAGTDSATMKILSELVVCIDPMQNPDGRERFLSETQQWAGEIPNPDAQSMQHGVWPGGRGNHYLFDMNRDLFTMTQRENQNRVRALLLWNPQLMIDSHEMGAYDTYLFYPPRQPINPNVPEHSKKWWKVFAAEQARAFDKYGWSYYTREWSDEWFPGYANSWALYTGAVGILYEQAGTDGSLVKRPDGTTLTFREAVHHHFVSSIANLSTAAANRSDLLKDFWMSKKNGLPRGKGEPRTFYLVPGKNPSRMNELVRKLMAQDIELSVAQKEFRPQDLHDAWGPAPASRTLPAGTFIVSLDQPMGRLAKAILEFDPRMTNTVLQEERKSLEKEKDTKMYDVTAWSLPISYGVEAYWSDAKPEGNMTAVKSLSEPEGSVQNPNPAFGYLIDCSDDHIFQAMARLFEMGYVLHCAREPFEVEGKAYPRGTVLLKVGENPKSLGENIEGIARSAGVQIRGVNTALSTKGPDLGGNDFVLLRDPRIALVAGPGVYSSGMGALWFLLDNTLKFRISLLYLDQLGGTDLEKYNVLVLPSGSSQAYTTALGKGGISRLKEWVSKGGTLIGIEGAAAFLADTSTGLSEVRLRQQALKDLELYAKAADMERKASAPSVDSLGLWNGKRPPKDTVSKAAPPAEKELLIQDERARLFMPRGAMLRVDLDGEQWLAYGAGEKVAAILYTPNVYLSKDPVQTPARFTDFDGLRVSGLLWPEARERWARTAYATREGRGKGQVILFSGDPAYRASFSGTERLLLNSLFLGPGFGTEHPVGW